MKSGAVTAGACFVLACLGALLFAGSNKKEIELKDRLITSKAERQDSEGEAIFPFAILGGLLGAATGAMSTNNTGLNIVLGGLGGAVGLFGGVVSAVVSIEHAEETRPAIASNFRA